MRATRHARPGAQSRRRPTVRIPWRGLRGGSDQSSASPSRSALQPNRQKKNPSAYAKGFERSHMCCGAVYPRSGAAAGGGGGGAGGGAGQVAPTAITVPSGHDCVAGGGGGSGAGGGGGGADAPPSVPRRMN